MYNVTYKKSGLKFKVEARTLSGAIIEAIKFIEMNYNLNAYSKDFIVK